MRYAINEQRERIQVSYSGQIAFCEICKSKVKGRKGDQRIKHWWHYKRKTIDCDNWSESISEWHLKWQSLFPKANREVVLTRNLKSHRADILLNNGTIIEVQNSNINFSEIERREEFYTKENNLIWIINGNTLADKSFITKDKFLFIQELTITIPRTINTNDEYEFSRIVKKTIKHPEISKLNNDDTIFIHKNENILIFKLQEKDRIKDFYLIEVQFKFYIACYFEDLYGQKDLENFREKLKIEQQSINYEIIENRIVKKYWRKFIDKIKQPVYIDNLNGINQDQIYNYSKNEIIIKDELISKFLKHV